MKFPCFLVLAFFLSTAAVSKDGSDAAETAKHRFTFSYPFSDDDAMKPRGSSTKGVPVTLDTQASAAWQSLQQAGIGSQERDRRAILAMAGEYRVSFDFLEVVQFDATAPKDRPYQSWATEKVYVVADRPDFISLQHILVMHILDGKGKPMSPFVTKHWRQDWQYEPLHLDEYLGSVRWQRRPLPASESRGQWSQTAYQVDDSPRYAALGRWQHNQSFSTWIGGDTLRPLPRREYTFRDDYQVLVASNRHTILATGWVQEENNLKQRIPASAPADFLPFAGREYGIARYERVVGSDFSAGDKYWQQTGALWAEVRSYWAELFARAKPICLSGAPDQKQLFMPLFELAGDDKKLAGAKPEQLRDWARQHIDAYLSTGECAPAATLSPRY
jgi:hypothetical protein